jgi:hypothetical protein
MIDSNGSADSALVATCEGVVSIAIFFHFLVTKPVFMLSARHKSSKRTTGKANKMSEWLGLFSERQEGLSE